MKFPLTEVDQKWIEYVSLIDSILDCECHDCFKLFELFSQCLLQLSPIGEL